MLMLGVAVSVGPGRHALPWHLGGALHGLVEAAVLNQDPGVLAELRPGGDQAPAHFLIQAPPIDLAGPDDLALEGDRGVARELTFGVVLFGRAEALWPRVLSALLRHAPNRLNGRALDYLHASVCSPGGEVTTVWKKGDQGFSDLPESQVGWLERQAASTGRATGAPQAPRLHHLHLRSPLLLASRGATRQGLQRYGQLPWPSLGSVLDSIAQRLVVLEPELAQVLGVGAGWSAGSAARSVMPLTPASDPAAQVVWPYQGSPRGVHPPRPRSLPKPGIVGQLIYPSGTDPLEAELLHWGQWLGLGQQTTMGCGQYVYRTT